MKILERYYLYIVLIIVFTISIIYLYWFGDYLFFYQENLTLFIFSPEYLRQFVIKPGGLLEYTGNFLAQGYFSSAYGSMILSVILTSIVIVVNLIYKRVSRGKLAPLFFIVIPSSLLLLMQLNFNWLMWGNLGFLFTLLYFFFSISSDKKNKRIITLVLFPLFYYFVGAFAWVYLGMYIVYSLVYDKGKLRFFYSGFLLLISGLSFILFKEVLFLQPPDVLFLSPFSLRNQFMHLWILYVLLGFIISFPLLVKLFSFLGMRNSQIRKISISSVLAVFIISILLLSKLYDTKVAHQFKLEKFVYEQDWNSIIEYQETVRLSNVIAQYYYNLALSEENKLCDRLFFSRQDFGPRALIIPWNAKAGANNIARGVYFYYAVGLINEAHRWAYESMVAQGYRPENIKLLIKTNLINGHYRITEKYINILKRTLHYRKWAEKYEAMLYRPDLIEADPELGKKLKLLPKTDFTITFNYPISNVISLLQENPDNKIAFEYIMAWYLFEKNINAIFNEFEKIEEMSYTEIPRHIEEALVLYKANTGMSPNFDSIKISDEIYNRFNEYLIFSGPFSGIKSSDKKKYQRKIENTYWFYYDFKR